MRSVICLGHIHEKNNKYPVHNDWPDVIDTHIEIDAVCHGIKVHLEKDHSEINMCDIVPNNYIIRRFYANYGYRFIATSKEALKKCISENSSVY